MAEIFCPKCGSLMILRTASRGKFAGKNFYGCSRWPSCDGVIDFNNDKSEEKKEIDDNFLYDNHKELFNQIPRNLIARSRFEESQVKFFENVCLPEELLELIDSDLRESSFIKAFSQWRIDFPSEIHRYEVDAEQKQVISVLEKILTRGRITLLSPYLENEIKKLFDISELEFDAYDIASFFNSLNSYNYSKIQINMFLDSREEKIFYNQILPEILENNFHKYVIPQINLESLISPLEHDYPNHRMDFLISHPELNEIIVVEIDGEQHKSKIETDQLINDLLNQSGFTIIRISAEDIRLKRTSGLNKLVDKLSSVKNRALIKDKFSDNKKIKLLLAIKLAHQIQVTLLQALQFGFLDIKNPNCWNIISDIDYVNVFDKSIAKEILRLSITDFLSLLKNVSKIYSIEISESEPSLYFLDDAKENEHIFISFTNRYLKLNSTFFVQDIYYPFHISKESISTICANHSKINIDRESLRFILKYIFRKEEFWEGQFEGICRLLKGKDTLLLLPTGSGKSIVYQLASMLLPGRTIVIDPIISLMEDQIDNLSMLGIDRCVAITSKIGNPIIRDRILKLFSQGEYIFVFISPERFQTNAFRSAINTLTIYIPIALIVVDEAHCVSEWGHDFRTAYLNIGRTTRIYCKSNNYTPPLIAMTGTASRTVLKDMTRELQIEDFEAIITPKTFDRKELNYEVIYASSQEKLARLIGYLRNNLPDIFSSTFANFYQPKDKKTYSGLIFCPHIGGRYGVEEIAKKIKDSLKIQTATYSGKEPKGMPAEIFTQLKSQITYDFKRNKIPLLVCTKAFGMGIDKPNIRYTIHIGLPPSIESFYQEAGRAGRDRRKAQCCVIMSNDYPKRTEYLLNPNTKIEEIAKVIESIIYEENDDITRVLFFHVNSFRGISNELEDVKEILKQLGNFFTEGVKVLPVSQYFKQKANNYKRPREFAEKAIHRLLLIGVIKDYTIDYANDEFTIYLTGFSKEEIIKTYGKYVDSYLYSRGQVEIEKANKFIDLSNEEFVLKMVELLLHFIYDVIEKGRRRALYEVFLAFSNSPDDNTIRQKILRYLEVTQFSENLDEILLSDNGGLNECKDLFESITSPNEAAELRGQVSRMLESYPDHPALLILRALSEIYCTEYNDDVVKQNFIASVDSAKYNFGMDLKIIFHFASWAIEKIYKRNFHIAVDLINILIESNDRMISRNLVEFLPEELAVIPAYHLINILVNKCEQLL